MTVTKLTIPYRTAAGLELTGDDLDELEIAIEATGAGSGPARPPSGG